MTNNVIANAQVQNLDAAEPEAMTNGSRATEELAPGAALERKVSGDDIDKRTLIKPEESASASYIVENRGVSAAVAAGAAAEAAVILSGIDALRSAIAGLMDMAELFAQTLKLSGLGFPGSAREAMSVVLARQCSRARLAERCRSIGIDARGPKLALAARLIRFGD